MKWFWVIISLVAAIVVWDLDNLFFLRFAWCVLLIDVAATEARKVMSPADRANSTTD